MSRDEALKKAHLQINSKNLQSIICIDIDQPDSKDICLQDDQLLPNIIIENPRNGHAHALYFLAVPVCRSARGRNRPAVYCDAVIAGLNNLLSGDKAYVGLIAKNPTHRKWNLLFVHDHRWTLHELSDRLYARELMPREYADLLHYAGVAEELGRNSSLFDWLRRWAYRAVRDYLHSRESFVRACQKKALQFNGEIARPMMQKEVYGIAGSVAKWVWKSELRTKSQEDYDNDFSRRQKNRGRRGGKASAKARNVKKQTFLECIKTDKSILQQTVEQLADYWCRSVRTIRRWLKEAGVRVARKTRTATRRKTVIQNDEDKVTLHKIEQLKANLADYFSMILSDLNSSADSDSISDAHTSTYTPACTSVLDSISDLDSCHFSEGSSLLSSSIAVEDLSDGSAGSLRKVQDTYDVCPRCGSPVWGSQTCTCMLEDDIDEDSECKSEQHWQQGELELNEDTDLLDYAFDKLDKIKQGKLDTNIKLSRL